MRGFLAALPAYSSLQVRGLITLAAHTDDAALVCVRVLPPDIDLTVPGSARELEISLRGLLNDLKGPRPTTTVTGSVAPPSPVSRPSVTVSPTPTRCAAAPLIPMRPSPRGPSMT